jgi:hypothetical protein
VVSGGPWVAVAAALLVNLAVGSGETGRFLSLEQVLVSRAAPRERLATYMSLYNVAGYVAGALGAAAVGKMADSPKIIFLLFLAGGIIQLLVYAGMRPEAVTIKPSTAPHGPSRALVRRLAGLFALDSFAGGFILQSLLVYWFQHRFGLGASSLGWIFFGTQMMSGISFLLAPALSRRLGLVNAMVFSHLVSNFFLIGVSFAPVPAVAVLLLLARHALSQIDVPTRQTFLMLAVEDHERERAASLTNMSRTLAQAASPWMTGWIMQAFSLGSPLILGGVLKIVYDLSLYAAVRKTKLA